MRNPARRVLDLWLEEVRTAATWQTGRRHFAARVLVTWAIEMVGILALARVVPGLVIRDVGGAVGAVVLLSLVNALVRPVLIYLTLPFTVLSFGLLTFLLNALMLVAVDRVVAGIEVRGPIAAILGGIGLAAINTVLAGLLALDEEESFYRNVVKRLARRQAGAVSTETPGIVLIQIDGLSAGVLRHAIRTGVAPNIARWIRTGSHRLVGWDCGLPSGTSGSQAGILHGRVDDIPAFRWYEKDLGRLLVSNRPADAAEIERRMSDGHGLLAGGSSVGNLFSGDAARAVLTMSTIAEVPASLRRRSRDFFYYLVNPYSVARAFFHMLGEIVIELFEARRQRLRDVQPRVSRRFPFPVLRAVSCILMRDLSVSLLIEDMYRGVPCTYADFVGYDEVAHHAGPERPEAIRVLEELDKEIGSLERAAAGAPRPYHFVLLSDHGQTQGATFLQRYGITLEELVSGLAGGAAVEKLVGSTESWGHLNAVVSELVAGPGAGSRAVRRSVGRRIRDGYVELGAAKPRPIPEGEPGGAPEVVVAASGNLGLVYFNAAPERLSLERINHLYPEVVEGLVAHPGIGFVLVRSDGHGPLVIGSRGVRYLSDDRVEGRDPLARFGRHAAHHLRRLDGYRNVGDLVVNSLYDHATDEVAAFEELVGSHGGLGGPQTQPFLLFPGDWDTEDPQIVGAVELHAVLRRWVGRTIAATGADEVGAAGVQATAAGGRVGAAGGQVPDPPI